MIESVIRTYTVRVVTGYHDDWTWEEMLVAVARTCFDVPDAPGGNEILHVRVGKRAYRITGTGSPAWNVAVQRLGSEVRDRERPYRRANYLDPGRVSELAQFIAARFHAAN